MLGRTALVGVTVVILGIVANPAVSYSAEAGHPHPPKTSKAQAATRVFDGYAHAHMVGLPAGGSFECRGSGDQRYQCTIVSGACEVKGVVVRRKPGTYAFRSISVSGICPKWQNTSSSNE